MAGYLSEGILERYEAFWRLEKAVLIRVNFPAPIPSATSKKIISLLNALENWDRRKELLEMNLKLLETRRELEDDTIPTIVPTLGPAWVGGILGVPLHYKSGFQWTEESEPLIDSWDKLDQIQFDPDHELMRKMLDLVDYLVDRAKDRYAVSMTEIMGPSDMMAYLRGMGNLSVDLFRHPDEVKRLAEFCTDLWIKAFDLLSERVSHPSDGSVDSWYQWMPGLRSSYWEEEIACFFSPRLYREFILPCDERIVNSLNVSWIHTHYVGRHILPILLELDKLNGIQYGSSVRASMPNEPLALDIAGQLEKLKGKKCLILSADPEDVKEMIEMFGPRGLLIYTYHDSLDSARRLVRKVRRWSAAIR